MLPSGSICWLKNSGMSGEQVAAEPCAGAASSQTPIPLPGAASPGREQIENPSQPTLTNSSATIADVNSSFGIYSHFAIRGEQVHGGGVVLCSQNCYGQQRPGQLRRNVHLCKQVFKMSLHNPKVTHQEWRLM
jgi:hypothetical protein